MIFVWAASLGLDWQIQAPGFANPAGAECGGWPKRRSRPMFLIYTLGMHPYFLFVVWIDIRRTFFSIL